VVGHPTGGCDIVAVTIGKFGHVIKGMNVQQSGDNESLEQPPPRGRSIAMASHVAVYIRNARARGDCVSVKEPPYAVCMSGIISRMFAGFV
jgi:hypothetical protein